eukprot:858373-Pleurochrysis_carterae.AAC.3
MYAPSRALNLGPALLNVSISIYFLILSRGDTLFGPSLLGFKLRLSSPSSTYSLLPCSFHSPLSIDLAAAANRPTHGSALCRPRMLQEPLSEAAIYGGLHVGKLPCGNAPLVECARLAPRASDQSLRPSETADTPGRANRLRSDVRASRFMPILTRFGHSRSPILRSPRCFIVRPLQRFCNEPVLACLVLPFRSDSDAPRRWETC